MLAYDDVMPSISEMCNIVDTARRYDRGLGFSEDEWNSKVHHPLLKLACSSSKHADNFEIFNV
jgi:hypothetical protein